MKILLTNDDGYRAPGLQILVDLMRPLGDLTVVAPKYHQSGMSMAISMGMKPIAVKQLSDDPHERWWYVDGTPASCVKYALDELFPDGLPDVCISGINHGANTASAALYSGTLGGAREAALASVPALGVSLDDMSFTADFTVVKEMFLPIFRKLMDNYSGRFGVYYNVNFPNLPASGIKGVSICHQGILHWVKEFQPYDHGMFHRLGISPVDMGITNMPRVEDGEKVYMMAGRISDDDRNTGNADHRQLEKGFISISAHNIDSSDYREIEELSKIDFGI
ncbi:MAG: 5'/3'-nucleotidase SurE [Bacteroidales bacterium]|nr:5'/3'-nucleotidase SurE [Bacteroidales bacterium]